MVNQHHPNQPDEKERRFVERHLGTCEVWEWSGMGHGDSHVWKVRNDEGKEAYCKRGVNAEKYQAECNALNQSTGWARNLAVPTLIAVDPQLRLLLLEAIPGTTLDGPETSWRAEAAAYEQAGIFLRHLHDIPCPSSDSGMLSKMLESRFNRWLTQAEQNGVPMKTIRWARSQLEPIVTDQSTLARYAHRDFSPRNWVWNGTCLSVIDFEHSGPDDHLLDLVRLWLREFADPQRGQGQASSFWRGYGKEPDAAEWDRMHRLAAALSLITVSWARKHGDADFEAHGWQSLRRLGADGIPSLNNVD
jgi:tRNA A-37 threonylcarbamoyl transferase component Bud32